MSRVKPRVPRPDLPSMSLLWDDGDALYAKAMACHWDLHGKLLLNPTPTDVGNIPVRIGDVGYFEKGRFFLLFHAVDNDLDPPRDLTKHPRGFVPLEYPNNGGTLTTPTPKKSYLTSDAKTIQTWEFGANATLTGLKFEVELHNNTFASVVTKYRQYVDDRQKKTDFQDYLKTHYKNWIEFARMWDRAIQPVLITGVTLTRDFVTLASANKTGKFNASVSFDVPTPLGVGVGGGIQGSSQTTTSHKIGYQSIYPDECTWDRTKYIDHRILERTAGAEDFRNSIALRYYQLTLLKRILVWIGLYPLRNHSPKAPGGQGGGSGAPPGQGGGSGAPPGSGGGAGGSTGGGSTGSSGTSGGGATDSSGGGGPESSGGGSTSSSGTAGGGATDSSGGSKSAGGATASGGTPATRGGLSGAAAPQEEGTLGPPTGHRVTEMYDPKMICDFLGDHDAVGDPLACVAFHIAWVCYINQIDDSVAAAIEPTILSDLDQLSREERRHFNIMRTMLAERLATLASREAALIKKFPRQFRETLAQSLTQRLEKLSQDVLDKEDHSPRVGLKAVQGLNNDDSISLVLILLRTRPGIIITNNCASLDVWPRPEPQMGDIDRKVGGLEGIIGGLERMAARPKKYDISAWHKALRVLDNVNAFEYASLHWVAGQLEELVLQPTSLLQRTIDGLIKGKKSRN